MSEVPAIFNPGMMPATLNARIAKKIVVSMGTKRLASTLPRISSAIDTRTKSSASSAMFWPRPGTSFARRAAITNSEMRMRTATTRTSMMRLNSKGVPSKKIAEGKNSEMDGTWKPPSSLEAARSGIVARLDRANSRYRGDLAVSHRRDSAGRSCGHGTYRSLTHIGADMVPAQGLEQGQEYHP